MSRWFESETKTFATEFGKFMQSREVDLSEVSTSVSQILAQVKQSGDAALLDYTAKFDGFEVDSISKLKVSAPSITNAYESCDPKLRSALQEAAARIADYHTRQMPSDELYHDEHGNQLGWQFMPQSSAGLYVPGGRAVYPSSVLMNAVPAKVAGVKRLVMTVPAPKGELNPVILVAAKIAGVDEIYQIGGAQAIAAMAYGTQSISPVDSIVGPGNAYVAEAKRQLFGTVGIDSVAGPSEICVVADNQNNPRWIAADLLSQAEHGAESQAILIADDKAFAKQVEHQINALLQTLPRADIARKSWQEYGAIILCGNVNQCSDLINLIAPEHLELAIENPQKLARTITAAGAIFMGRFTPEAFGDYNAGPSHVLPTGGTARFSSGLSVYNFLNRQSLILASQSGIATIGSCAITIAQSEGLDAHALSVACRLEND